MAPKTLGSELKHAMKELRLGQLLPTLAERIALAEKDELPLEDFLLGIFSDEVERRRSASAARRADSAGLDPDMVFERWDKSAKITYDRRVLQELTSLRFVEAQRDVIVLGPVGPVTFCPHCDVRHGSLPVASACRSHLDGAPTRSNAGRGVLFLRAARRHPRRVADVAPGPGCLLALCDGRARRRRRQAV
jgi:IstB-like ATP binding protein